MDNSELAQSSGYFGGPQVNSISISWSITLVCPSSTRPGLRANALSISVVSPGPILNEHKKRYFHRSFEMNHTGQYPAQTEHLLGSSLVRGGAKREGKSIGRPTWSIHDGCRCFWFRSV
jgi:hypothetical protein